MPNVRRWRHGRRAVSASAARNVVQTQEYAMSALQHADTQPGHYPRDLIGYGRKPPHARWPGGARIAVQFVLNYEEGGENSVLHGDAGSEQFLSELFNPASYA